MTGTLGGAVAVSMVCWKMAAKVLMAFSWASPMWANGAAGAGFRRAAVNSLAAIMALSADDACGILVCVRKNSTVSEMRSFPVTLL